MKSYQFSTCHRIDGEIVVIEGLFTPYVTAENRSEALALLNPWFVENKCRPFREVT